MDMSTPLQGPACSVATAFLREPGMIDPQSLIGTPDAQLAELIAEHQRAKAEADRYAEEVSEDAVLAYGKAREEVDGWLVEILHDGKVDRCLRADDIEVQLTLAAVDRAKMEHGEDWRKHCPIGHLDTHDSMERHKERVAARIAEITVVTDIDRINKEEDRLSDVRNAAYDKIVDFPVTTFDGFLAKIEFHYHDFDESIQVEYVLKDLHRVAQSERRRPCATAGEG
jgi:hypothetical protein